MSPSQSITSKFQSSQGRSYQAWLDMTRLFVSSMLLRWHCLMRHLLHTLYAFYVALSGQLCHLWRVSIWLYNKYIYNLLYYIINMSSWVHHVSLVWNLSLNSGGSGVAELAMSKTMENVHHTAAKLRSSIMTEVYSHQDAPERTSSHNSHMCGHVMQMFVGMLMMVVGDDGHWAGMSHWQLKKSDNAELTADGHMQTQKFGKKQILMSARIDWWVCTFKVVAVDFVDWLIDEQIWYGWLFYITIPSLILRLWWHRHA